MPDFFSRIWPWLLGFLVLINVVYFPIIENSAGPWYGAIPSYSSQRAALIISEHMEGVKQRYQFDFALAEYTQDPSLIIFSGSLIESRYQVLIAVSEVVVAEYDPLLSPKIGEDLLEHLVVTGTDYMLGEYGIALPRDGHEISQLVAVIYDDVFIVADLGLLPEAFVELVYRGMA